jgi:two-component system, chemotaxis family, sensor kinase CheA
MTSEEDLKLFISEAEELLQKVEFQILELEENPENNKPIKELYFAFHTLKGLTAMVGLENVSEFCHNYENLLDKSSKKELSKQKINKYVEMMFDGLDLLRSVLDNVKDGNIEDIDSSLVDELTEGLEENDSEYEITFIKPIPKEKIDTVIGNSKNTFFNISITLQKTCVFKKVRLFIIFRALNEIGQICWSNPKPEILEAGECDLEFEIFYISEKSKEEIIKVLDEILEIENKAIKKLSKKDFKKILQEASKHIKEAPTDALDYYEEGSVEEAQDLKKVATIEEDFADETGKITSVKVNIQILENLMDYFGEVVIMKNQLNQILQEAQNRKVSRVFDNMDKLFLEIQEIIFTLKLVRVETTFRRYKRLVRDVSKETDKNVRFKLKGTDVELDRKILEQLNSPIIHLLRNAIYHGIEPSAERTAKGKPRAGTLELSTFRRSGSVFIEIEDDGKGINYNKIRNKAIEIGNYSAEEVMNLTKEELNKLILTPGFSTLSKADMISGRGMGLAIVAEKIRELGGTLEIESKKSEGTTFRISVPFSRAILKAQLLKVAGDLFAIPIENIEQIYFFNPKLIEYVKREEYYRLESELIPVIRLKKYLDLHFEDGPENGSEEYEESKEHLKSNSKDKIAILCKRGEKSSAIFIADEILHQMDVVIKPFRSKYSSFQEILGVSITGDGSICLIIDVFNIINSMTQELKGLKLIEAS